MVAFTYRMNQGVPGDLTRPSNSTVEAQALNSSTPFTAFGAAGYMDSSGKFSPMTAATTAVQIYGFLVRPFPFQGANASDPLGTSVPRTSGLADVLRRGYISVVLAAGTALAGLNVYLRIAAGATGRPVGSIEAAPADPANCILLTNAYFLSAADASGNVEIGFNI